jgi:hypothetical protein
MLINAQIIFRQIFILSYTEQNGLNEPWTLSSKRAFVTIRCLFLLEF